MCGVFGIHGHDEAANITYLGLHALQHRGQESAGLVAANDATLRRHAAMGLVSDTFDRDTLAKLPGSAAIGHVRYSTAGSSELRNAQPFVFEYAGGAISMHWQHCRSSCRSAPRSAPRSRRPSLMARAPKNARQSPRRRKPILCSRAT